MTARALRLIGRLAGSWPSFSLPSPRKSAGKPADVVDISIRRKLADPRFIARCLDIAFPAPSQHAQCLLAARFTGANPETIRRWLHGITRPSLQDFGPVLFVVFQKRASRRTYSELAELMNDV